MVADGRLDGSRRRGLLHMFNGPGASTLKCAGERVNLSKPGLQEIKLGPGTVQDGVLTTLGILLQIPQKPENPNWLKSWWPPW